MSSGKSNLPAFRPPRLIAGGHVQSCLASAGPRSLVARRRAKTLLANSERLLLESEAGVLVGHYSPHPGPARALAVLIHGWEGSARSSYILSLGAKLFAAGMSVCRLELRDHGDSHALNRGVFHANRLEETALAVGRMAALAPHPHTVLAGFSLGGNFALRLAAAATRYALPIAATAAVCPVVEPATATRRIEEGFWFYHHYFRRKWLSSLEKKIRAHPGLDLGLSDPAHRREGLWALNERVIPRGTEFRSAAEYFQSYALSRESLGAFPAPTLLLTSVDDPFIPPDDARRLDGMANLTLEVAAGGGHCGFLEDLRLTSYADRRVAAFFEARLSGGERAA